MTDWDELEREVTEQNARMNDEAMTSPEYLRKREILRQQIESGMFDCDDDEAQDEEGDDEEGEE